MTSIFPIGVAALETGAALVYAWQGNVKLSVLWGGYAVAAWVLAGLE
jgi:hypothetical protein